LPTSSPLLRVQPYVKFLLQYIGRNMALTVLKTFVRAANQT